MKKLLVSIVLGLLFNGAVWSQTIYWIEDFNTNQGWTLDQNWSLNGGKLQFLWTPTITNFDLSAVSPEIDLIQNTQELIIKQHLDAFGSSTPPEAAEIILMTQDDEFLLWDYTLNYGDWGVPSGSEIQFDISEFAGQTVQFKFRTYGPSTYQWNWWDIFSLELTAVFENDLAAISVSGPSVMNPDESGAWSVVLKNLGSQPQSGFSVSLFSLEYDEQIGLVDIADYLNPQETISIDFEWIPALAHNTALIAIVDLSGDEFEDNNISKSHFVRIKPDIDFTVLVWNNDNGIQTIADPEVGDKVTPTTSLTRTLDNTGISYQLVNALPAILDGYDMIFASLGCYCLS
jgi:hypothetical protein